jgi:hypothetical protein
MIDDKLVDIINVQILLCIVYYNETVGPTILIQQMKCKRHDHLFQSEWDHKN